MKLNRICKTYFSGFSIINDPNETKTRKLVAKISIASYFFVLPPIIFGIGYGISKIYSRDEKIKPKIKPNPNSSATSKTQEQGSKILHKKPIDDPNETNLHQKQASTTNTYPVVNNNLKQGFFVDVLNCNGYSLNGKDIAIPPAQMPVAFTRNNRSLKECLDDLKATYHIHDQNPIVFQFKDLTTEQAINESHASRIALNFANEHHAGGGPGFHWDQNSQLFIYDAPSARAQEESLCQRSNLMASLTQLPHTLKADSPTSYFIRSYYDTKFDSKTMAYVSLNHLFAVQEDRDFYRSHYLEEPKSVAFVTSAAANYAGKEAVDCSKTSEAYQDARQRIETHLLAAASRSGISKTDRPDQPVELILGAFGCGVFAPKQNPDEYRQMIASIYKELLPEFKGFFDVVTFAVPTFGNTNPSNPTVANYKIFESILKF